MAWRPSQALETRTFSARAASSRCSSAERLTESRCFESIFRGTCPVLICCILQHGASIVPGRLQYVNYRAGSCMSACSKSFDLRTMNKYLLMEGVGPFRPERTRIVPWRWG